MDSHSRPRQVPRSAKSLNRFVVPIARWFPIWAVLNHRGRKSGREYSTPVAVIKKQNVYRIALPYGADVDWARNVLAAGEFTIEHRGRTVTLTDPRVVHDPSVSWAPIGGRQILRRLGVHDHLQATATG